MNIICNDSGVTLPRLPGAPDPNRPKTLTEAKERIEELNEQIRLLQLVGSATAPAARSATLDNRFVSKTSHKPLMGTAKTKDPNTGPMTIKPAPPFPKSADAPVPIQQILDRMSLDELRVALTGELDPLRLRMVYKEVQRRRALVNY